MENKKPEEMNKAALVEHIQEQDRKMIELAKTNGRLEAELEQEKKGSRKIIDHG